jgi:hypothetical protein
MTSPPTAVYKATKESFTLEVIVASWKRTGMWPADFDLIRSRNASVRRVREGFPPPKDLVAVPSVQIV